MDDISSNWRGAEGGNFVGHFGGAGVMIFVCVTVAVFDFAMSLCWTSKTERGSETNSLASLQLKQLKKETIPWLRSQAR